MISAAAFVLAATLGSPVPPARATATPAPSREETVITVDRGIAPTPTAVRPDDKTFVASFEIEQGSGKERLSVYRDGTLALVRTYLGVQTLKKKVLSEDEVDFVRRVCSETLALDVAEYRVDALRRGQPRRFRIEVGRTGEEPRVFGFDELAQVPLVLGRARGALEGLLDRFDESTVSQDDLWDPSGLRAGDVLTRRVDRKRYRIVRDDTFVRSLEMLEVERTLQRLVVLRDDIPRLFFDPASEEGKGPDR
ncbi:MAG: hypothetical protein U0529_08270 [Thermoanaerobaculia bacterium]